MKKLLLLVTVLSGLFLLSTGDTMAQEDVQDLNAAELESLLAPFFAEKLEEHNVPGAVFIMVKDGEVLFANGYGYADVEQQIPYDATETIIRGGSTIKPITALAVMQLAEQGKVDVHADINQYLTSFQLPDTFAEPVTLHHLLHHTSGIDSKFSNTRVDTISELEPLGAFLARELPERVAPPGEIRNYNDFGIALAGLVVEEVSGMTFAEYAEQNIFAPLQMNDTWMIVPESEVPRMANGYTAVSGRVEPNLVGNYLLNTAPGAAYNTTAMDLGNYMLAYLQNGRFGDTQIVQPESMAELQRTQFQHNPHMPGMAYAFDEVYQNGYRLLAKSGGAPGTNNRMVLIPEENVAFFVSYNRHHGRLHNDLTNLIMDTYFPENGEPTFDTAVSTDLAPYTGYYREHIGYSATTFEKISGIGNQIQVTANENGTLNMFGRELQSVGDGLLQRTDNGDYVAAGKDSVGKQYLFFARTAYERLPWYETMPVQLGLLLFSLVVFVAAIVFWLWGVRHGAGNGRILGAIIGLANILFIVGFALFFMNLTGSGEPPWLIEYGMPQQLVVLLAIPLITLALTVVFVGLTAVNGFNHQLGTMQAIMNILIIFGCTAFYFFLYTWNLIGYHA